MNIAIIGTGYVGLVAGACFAESGNKVICVDVDAFKIEAIKAGQIPIFEPGLSEMVERNILEKRLQFTTSTAEAVKKSEVIFLCVGTPPLPNGKPDMKQVRKAAEEIGAAMDGYRVIVNKSTVPIGTNRSVTGWIAERTEHKFDVVSNPEFLKEGAAIQDFLKPDRVVVGTTSDRAMATMMELYSPFVRQGHPIIQMDAVSAELSKYSCNAFLATRISFMNEMAVLCDTLGADIEQVRASMSTDSRIGPHFLYAGIGYGGSCFPKDVQALLACASDHDELLSVVEAAEDANHRHKNYLVDVIKEVFAPSLKGITLAVWGLAFKPNTDDVRCSPAIAMIEQLVLAGATLKVYDPHAMTNAREILSDSVTFSASAAEAAHGAHAIVIATEWPEFRNQNLLELKDKMADVADAVIFDGRNMLNSEYVRNLGFFYRGIGRC